MVDSDERDADTGRASAPDGPGAPSGADGPSAAGDRTDPAHGPAEPDLNDLLATLDALSDTVDEGHEREKVRQTISLVERMPGTGALAERITKYTSRDLAESFVGAVLFALPLLVEGGVFEIAAWFAAVTVAGVPVLLIGHVGFIFLATAGLLYFADFRQITIRHPIFGLIPRRYAGVLLVSLATSSAMLLFWGRLHEGDPTAIERAGRIAVVWAAAAFGAGLGDILPGESQGEDLGKFDLDIGDD
ncbi:hypothetical protein C463_03719 [Halorubrum californiense DSM 19288]|uniref:DUF2391 domain-containing protein n=1 Tax=Halorubrum californiense DSM 19288 TaxID=1227465 RepID=M0EG17_9EURY|nr:MULTISPECIES: hypothetical protein [Halorubrum]ELZ46705.1 hypothetical protein C463_03719 [Halorubrum californiense DSM 19288]TKX67860.1 DUF2391 domain-containing protein [Halorubrum sp. GN11GM_10-3_MGM]